MKIAMKKTYITPSSEALTLDGQDFVCASNVPGDVTISVGGSAADNNVSDGDSRYLIFMDDL